MSALIPEALHICPGCGDLATGGELCEDCVYLSVLLNSRWHAARANQLFTSLPRVTAAMPEDLQPIWKRIAGSLVDRFSVSAERLAPVWVRGFIALSLILFWAAVVSVVQLCRKVGR